MQAALPSNEHERQAALNALHILGTERSVEFDIFPELASELFSTPIAAISLVDKNRQWFKASVGLDLTETPRELSFCAHALLNPSEVLCVPDATKDPRFSDNPLVVGEFGLRFYAGAPIIGPSGHAVGAMCVIDREPRFPDDDMLKLLARFSIGVSSALKRHASELELRKQKVSQAMIRLMLASVFQTIETPVAIVRSTGNTLLANPAYTKFTGYSGDELARMTLEELTSADCRVEMISAHEQQVATGNPCEMDITLIRKNGEKVPVHFTSTIVQEVDTPSFHVITLRSLPTRPVTPRRPEGMQAIAGSVQFLGLNPIKAAYGARWEATRNRLMLAAESILKRRLSEVDVYSRTDDDGFSIWFKQGTEEENAAHIVRIGREIRLMLLGELGDEAPCTVESYTQTTHVADPAAPPSVVMERLTKDLADRRLEAQQEARTLLDSVMRNYPRELTPVNHSSGQATQLAFIDLPRALQGQFAGAMSLVGGPDSHIDAELFRLGLAERSIMDDVAEGRNYTNLITFPATLLISRKGRERFFEHWRKSGPAVGPRLLIMLSGVSQDINQTRLAEVARMLQPMTKGVGVVLDQIERLPFDMQSCPFSMIGLSSESAKGISDAKLRAFVIRMHQAKARLLVRLTAGESPQRWRSLGIDLTTLA